jgi:hypothetical protein
MLPCRWVVDRHIALSGGCDSILVKNKTTEERYQWVLNMPSALTARVNIRTGLGDLQAVKY